MNEISDQDFVCFLFYFFSSDVNILRFFFNLGVKVRRKPGPTDTRTHTHKTQTRFGEEDGGLC